MAHVSTEPARCPRAAAGRGMLGEGGGERRPWAPGGLLWAMSHESLTIDNRLINELFDYTLKVLCIPKNAQFRSFFVLLQIFHLMFSGRYWSHTQDLQKQQLNGFAYFPGPVFPKIWNKKISKFQSANIPKF